MGILRFYGDFIVNATYPGLQLRQLPGKLEGLSIDLNGTFHAIAQQVYAYGKNSNVERSRIVAQMTPEVLEVEFQQALGTYLGSIITSFQPEAYLLLCVDGVAPPAKASQQRSRRYTSALPKESKDVAIGFTTKSPFDIACITPGTEFMNRLDLYLQNWIATNRQYLPPLVVYSSHMVAGEGEAKIYKLLRNGTIPEGTGYHATFGLDADLVMLSSLCPFTKCLLIRENAQDIVDISALRSGVVADMTIGWKTSNSKLVIQDFVLMVYFVGNDFLPHMMCFEEVKASLDLMFSLYRKTPEVYLTDAKGQIEWDNLNKFVLQLAAHEPLLLVTKAQESWVYPCTLLDAVLTKTPTKTNPRSVEGKSIYQRHGKKYYTVSPFTEESFSSFRSLWYHNALGLRSEQGETLTSTFGINPVTPEAITSMCSAYIYGLQWILNYYLGGPVSTRFIYPYFHTPLLTDLAYVMHQQFSAKTAPTVTSVQPSSTDVELNPLHQLVSVIPPSSSYLIPKDYRGLILGFGSLSDMCPSKFVIERLGKDEEWQGVAILPPLNLDRVIAAVDSISRGKIPENMQPASDWILHRGPRFTVPNLQMSLVPPRGRGRGRGSSNASRGRGRGRGRGGRTDSDTSRGRGRETRGRGRGGSRGQPSKAWTSELLM